MILSVSEFQSMGFRVSVEENAIAERAIKDTELFFIKHALGDELYFLLLTQGATAGNDYYIANNGNDTMAGLKQAIGHLAFAALLVDNVNSTRTGSVKKRDDYSSQASEDDIYKQQRYHYTIGKAYLDEVCAFMNVTPDYSQNYLYEYF